MQDGGGIDFTNYTDGNVAGTSGLEVLKDYEEGTWTPVLVGQTDANGGTWDTTLTGTYTKIGNRVMVTLLIVGTDQAFTSTTGWRYYSGLPYNVGKSGGGAVATSSVSAAIHAVGLITSAEYVYLYGISNTSAFTELSFNGWYEVA